MRVFLPIWAATLVLTPQASAEETLKHQILSEMLEVVTQSPAVSGPDFDALKSVLNQGGSLEGIYNGLTHGKGYRELEESHQPSAPEQVDFFCRASESLVAASGRPVHWTTESALPLQPPEFPDDEAVDAPVNPIDPGKCRHHFKNANVFTLKRLLGDQVLDVVGYWLTQPQDRQKLVDWFGPWAVQMAQEGIPLGLGPRHSKDPAFHRQWVIDLMADSAKSDVFKWECLNRVHRILNHSHQRERGFWRICAGVWRRLVDGIGGMVVKLRGR